MNQLRGPYGYVCNYCSLKVRNKVHHRLPHFAVKLDKEDLIELWGVVCSEALKVFKGLYEHTLIAVICLTFINEGCFRYPKSVRSHSAVYLISLLESTAVTSIAVFSLRNCAGGFFLKGPVL